MFTIEMLPADEGDALWIEYGDPVRRIVIDCGRKTAYRAIAERLEGRGMRAELFVLTHVDADHITGALPLLRDARFSAPKFKDVWFNAWNHLNGRSWDDPPVVPGTMGAQQGEFFGALLRDGGHKWNEAFDHASVVVPDDGPLPRIELEGDMVLTLLGPTPEKLNEMAERWVKDLGAADPAKQIDPGDHERALEVLGNDRMSRPDVMSGRHQGPIDVDALLDTRFAPDPSEPNGSSISFLAEHDGVAVLFGADAHAPQLEASVRRLLRERGVRKLPLTAFKLPHHGSARNTSTELLELLDCAHYLISTNGTRHDHPDPEALARVIGAAGRGVHLHFNYESEQTRPWNAQRLRDAHGYTALYPEGDAGLKIVL